MTHGRLNVFFDKKRDSNSRVVHFEKLGLRIQAYTKYGVYALCNIQVFLSSKTFTFTRIHIHI